MEKSGAGGDGGGNFERKGNGDGSHPEMKQQQEPPHISSSLVLREGLDVGIDVNNSSPSPSLPSPLESQPSMLESRIPNDLSWQHISMATKKRKILNSVWGEVKHGETLAVMGPSGSGKTSLLNLLAGRVRSTNKVSITGNIFVNHEQINPVEFKEHVAYVTQTDTLLSTFTPREALRFSATLRLKKKSSWEIEVIVNQTLNALGLNVCADTLIGDELIRGISGGERKRTSVGVEIITNPSIIFLDEPISGLDSYGGYSLVMLLKQIAKSNATILFTIHQPSSEIFFLLDNVIFLRSGRVFYQGSVHRLIEYFANHGYNCPANYNPADYVMFICQTEEEERLLQRDIYPASPAPETELPPPELLPPSGEKICNMITEYLSKFFVQIGWISYRELLSTFRNKPALIGRFGVVIVINVLFALIFRGAGGRNDANQANFQGHLGAIVIVVSAAMFNTALPSIVNFPSERLRFVSESTVGTYSAGSYMIGKTLIEVPLAFLQAIVQTTVVYWSIQLQGPYILIALILWAVAITSGALGILLGCLVKDPKQAVEFAPLIFVPQLLFVGFYIRTSLIPVYIRWVQYLCPLKYGVNLAFLVEYVPTSGIARRNWSSMLDENSIHLSDWWIYVLILLSIYCGCKILSTILLSKLAI